MRHVIFGAGAIGGLVGARLHQAGHEVLLIARGAHHDAIARDGLTMLTPSERETFRLPVVASAAQAGLREDDVVLLCVKSQDTWGALVDLRDAAPSPELPVFCLQNGVENERAALRLFANTYGALVLVPAEHLEPGVVVGYGAVQSGRIDVGRIPAGVDQLASEVSAALASARFDSSARENVMVHKYAKLLNNLGNSVQAICDIADRAANAELVERAKQEGREVLSALRIDFEIPAEDDVQDDWRKRMGAVDGRAHQGGSTWQSVKRGAGAVETDFLNGEIVLLARQIGVQVPVNQELQELARTMIIEGRQPGWLTPQQVLSRADGRSTSAAR
ncbi:MAG TPA: 2-dehydropantoate 2-reductase [Solirubrobacteraceae bacterium]|nr:2-dehydropantoate 2-reductase [Solirubrobacteraceae bacterium]